ncbi:uncharacterized protein LOC135698679 [Ochlerotatus camptorhynchus]|uniref:uncharacterized protein LOC135698679 n=1 Tax=Ochlerotatus camptorhynchus TaxID=644619 RepID=UPI0031E3EE55
MSTLIQLAVFLWAAALSSALQPDLYAVDVSCAPPSCATEADQATLWPFRDPNFYIICEPPQWHLIRRPCLYGTLFDFTHQQCVHPSQWEKPCPPTTSLPECPRVVCQTILDQRQLWPEEDPSFFLQCIPGPTGGMVAVRRECAMGYLFSYSLQLCVDARFWEQDCTFDVVITPQTTPDEELETTSELPQTTTEPPQTTTEPPQTTTVPSQTTTEQSPQTTTEQPPQTTTEQLPQTTTEQPQTTTEQPTTTTEQPETTTEEPQTTTFPPPETTTLYPETTTPYPDPGTTTDPIRGTCPVPVCMFQDPTLYPHTDWTMFYQCIPNEFGHWIPIERDCGAGTFFHGGFQFCVNRWEWEDYCI